MAKRSEVQKREAKLLVKIKDSKHIDAKLRFALLASLRIAIFIEIEVVNPCRVRGEETNYLPTWICLKKKAYPSYQSFFLRIST